MPRELHSVEGENQERSALRHAWLQEDHLSFVDYLSSWPIAVSSAPIADRHPDASG